MHTILQVPDTTPIWQIILWILNALFFIIVTFIGFWFKNFLEKSFDSIAMQFKEMKDEVKAIREEMQKGAVNFNTNNIKIQDLEVRLSKQETILEGLKDEHNRCSVCHAIKK